jgi:hypothetical protein
MAHPPTSHLPGLRRTSRAERKTIGWVNLHASLLNPELNEKGPPAAAGGAKRVGKPLQRFYTDRFHAHAFGQPNPVEVGMAEVEESF